MNKSRSELVPSNKTEKFKSQIKGSNFSMNEKLESNIRISYILQKIPDILLSQYIEQVQEQDYDESKLNLKITGKSKKFYLKKVGKLRIEVPSWAFCFCKGALKMEIRNCRLFQNILEIGEAGENNIQYICFDLLTVSLKRIDMNRFRINIPDYQQKSYLFEGQSEKQTEEWCSILSEAISESYGNKFSLRQILKNQQTFDKYIYVAQKDFTDRCNNGDLLLYKCDFTFAKIQRLATSSDFDHVAIVLKNTKNQVFIFQSTPSAGVSIMQWKHFIKYRMYNFVDRIAWRQLKLPLTKKDIQIIQQFITDNKGKDYDITFSRIMNKYSRLIPSQPKQKKSFFCSQLVAALYKQLKLLDPIISSSQYYPATFSKQMPLLRGELGPIKILTFQQDLIQLPQI